MHIIMHPADCLRAKCDPVEEITDEVIEKAGEMQALMGKYGGQGLAAPQVGWNVRLFVTENLVAVNPRVVWKSRELAIEPEGCLSIPSIVLNVRGRTRVELEYTSLDGEVVKVKSSTPREARIWLHELDHLDGVLILDKAIAAERPLLKKLYRDGIIAR